MESKAFLAASFYQMTSNDKASVQTKNRNPAYIFFTYSSNTQDLYETVLLTSLFLIIYHVSFELLWRKCEFSPSQRRCLHLGRYRHVYATFQQGAQFLHRCPCAGTHIDGQFYHLAYNFEVLVSEMFQLGIHQVRDPIWCF